MAIYIRQSETVSAIYKSYEDARDEEERTYLGGSVIGDACERKLWYGFRWATPPEQFDGRMLRLFSTGHREEARMVDDLRRAGVEVWDVNPEDGEQWGVIEVGGHFRGHLDGVALGVKEAPKTPHVLEAKTHSPKSFKKLLVEGVRNSKPMHYAQMQIYMHLMGLTRALYMAYGKIESSDDPDEKVDSLYAERVEYDPVFALRLLNKAERIVTAPRPPLRLHADPNAKMNFDCRYCPSIGACHKGEWARRNCRTCLYATPVLDGEGSWLCERHGHFLTRKDQEHGCAQHLFIPELVPGEQIDADERTGTVTYRLNDGRTWIDGQTENPKESA